MYQLKCFVCALIVCFVVSPALADKFTIEQPVENGELKLKVGVNSVHGSHQFEQAPYVYIFLVDRFGHYYNQSPAVRFAGPKWRHTNVSAGDKNIVEAVFAQVDAKGHEFLEQWARNGDFGAKKKSLVEGLPGFKKLADIFVDVDD